MCHDMSANQQLTLKNIFFFFQIILHVAFSEVRNVDISKPTELWPEENINGTFGIYSVIMETITGFIFDSDGKLYPVHPLYTIEMFERN